ncbi:restriction endonuclease subunit S [Salmonella enterica subsp. enterica]|nr:restriction endonuclease subunit S [Salmonella enterica subsp. enterica]
MSGGQLPEGWTTAPVSTVTTLIRGVTYKKEQALNYLQDDYLPLIRANNIQNGKFDTTDLVFVPKNLVKESQKISPEDIVIAMSSGSKSVVGKSAHQRLPFECSFGAFCGALRPEKYISPSFIAHFTKSSFYRNKISSLSAGANINNIKPASFDLINIPIPSLAEQKIIAEKLDTLLAQVDSTKARLEQISQILKRFRQAVLSAATSGRLISETDISLSRSKWDNVKLIEVIQTKPRNGYSPKGVDYSTDVKNLTLSATTKGYFNEKCFKYVDVIIPGDSHLWLKNGDFLIQRANSLEYVGVSALYEGKDDQFIYPDLMMKFRANNKIHPKYLYYSLQTEKARKYFRDNATGTTGNMPKINQSVVSNTPINLPPLPEQHEIVRRVEQLFAWADTIEKQVNNALTRVNSLTQSILAKAFRGELTAQWRAENPDLISGENSAAALLEKIKAERAASGGKKTSRKKA